MIKTRVLFAVAIAILFVMLSLSLPVLAKPSCTCMGIEVARTGSITYTIAITASEDSLWYDVVESVSEARVFGPSSSDVLTDVVLQAGYTYYTRVADSEDGPYYSYPECAITLSPTSVEITSFTATEESSSVTMVALLAAIIMIASLALRRR